MAEPTPVNIGDRQIGPGCPVYVIAEGGVNHNGSFERALAMCDAALDAGADAVKFQAYQTDAFVSAEAEQAKYQEKGTGRRRSQADMLRELELSAEEFGKLAEHCRKIGIEFLASPFDVPSVGMLLSLGVRALKIASPELADPPVLRVAAASGLPLIVSTGAATMAEIDEAVKTVVDAGCVDLILSHCVSRYPTQFAFQNLKMIATLTERFGCVVGYSDHSKQVESGQTAVRYGAMLLEKHFTLDKDDVGPDHAMSLEPNKLASYVRLAHNPELLEGWNRDPRAVKSAGGSGQKTLGGLESESRRVSRKSVAAKVDIPAGTVIRREMLTLLRPFGGIPPEMFEWVIGAKAARDIPAGHIIFPVMVAKDE